MPAVFNTYPPGLGEPINVVISNASDPVILTTPGFMDFMVRCVPCSRCVGAHAGLQASIQFAEECLGQHSGLEQQANLGDGQGLGTCEPPDLARRKGPIGRIIPDESVVQ